jgi:NADH:ubiquinone oxidoreductase subunit E
MNKKKHIIKICMGSSCFARGNSTNLQIIESFIKENSLQANIELIGARCMSECKDGPSIIIDDTKYQISSHEELINLLKRM